MVHNRREFWERTFEDAYELAYQTYVILALREAAELAPALGAEDRAARWRAEADRIQQAMLSHPDPGAGARRAPHQTPQRDRRGGGRHGRVPGLLPRTCR